MARRTEATTALRFVMSGQNAVSAVFDGLKKQKKDLSDKPAVVEVDANDNPFQHKVDNVRAILKKVEAARATATVDVNDKAGLAKLAAFDLALDRLNKRVVSPKVRGIDSLMVQALKLHASTDKLGSVAGAAVGGAGEAGGGLTQGALPLVGALPPQAQVAAIGSAIAALPFIAQAAAGGITFALGGALAGVAALGASKSKSVQHSFAQLKNSASKDLVAIGKPFVPVMNSILATAKSTMNQMTPVFTTAVQSISGPFKTFANAFIKAFGQPAVKTAIAAVALSFGKLLTALTPTLGADVAAIANGITNIANAVAANPQAFADFISDLFKIAGGALNIISSLARVATWIESHWNVVKWIVVPAIAAIQLLVAHWGELRHETAVIFDGIRHEVAHLWDMMFQTVIGTQIRFAHNVETQFNSLRHRIAIIFDATRHDIAHVWDVIWSNTIGRVIRGISSVVGWFRGMPGRISGAIGNVGGLLYAKGKAVIQGFWNGLTFIWHKVTGWISGIAKWVKDHKGPVSLDAKLLVPAGKAIMSGFLHGLTSGFGAVGSFLGGVAGKVGGFFSGLFGGGGGNQGAKAALMMAAGAHGWGSGAEWAALDYVEMREAGYNIHARNPSSGAYGMAQFINGPSEYAQYGGNAFTAMGQAIGMTNYIAQRYGNPINAAMHERMFNWYAKGTNNARPGWAVIGELGPELVRFGGGERVIPSSQLRGGNGGTVVHNHFSISVPDTVNPRDVGRKIVDYIAQYERGSGKSWRS